MRPENSAKGVEWSPGGGVADPRQLARLGDHPQRVQPMDLSVGHSVCASTPT